VGDNERDVVELAGCTEIGHILNNGAHHFARIQSAMAPQRLQQPLIAEFFAAALGDSLTPSV
jgi:hypothetical protein